MESIGERAFANNNLSDLVIPDSVTAIGDEAFQGSSDLSVYLPTRFDAESTTSSVFDSDATLNHRDGITGQTDALIGDVDNSGDLGVDDAISILRTVVGLEESMTKFPGVNPSSLMDVDQSGAIGVGDAIAVLRSIVGLNPITTTVALPLING